jgi:hypothetical protein
MFVARSTAGIRRARLAFLVAALFPTAVLVGWAVHLRSDAHRATVERRWQEALGLPISVGRIEHPRPGVIRVHDCVLPAWEGRPAIVVAMLELESSADEDRLRLPWVAGDSGTAAVAIELAGRWLTDDLRFRRACIIDIARFSWGDSATRDGDDPNTPLTPLRIECVRHEGSRAIRIVRRGSTDDEVRVVRHTVASPDSSSSYDIDAVIRTPIPVAVVAMAAGHLPSLTAGGPQATVTGTLEAKYTHAGWQGEARGTLAGLDLATAAAALGDHAAGVATIELSRLAWHDGRLTDGLFEASTGEGWIDRRLFDRIVLALAARPGAAAARVPPTEPLAFDTAACIVAIGPHGVQVQPSARVPAGLAITRGEILLAPPAGPVSSDRVAWLFSSPGTTFGPTAGPGAWLMSVLPPLVPKPAPTGGDRRF